MKLAPLALAALSACNSSATASTDGAMRVKGRELYRKYCALCHGERGDGHGLRREGLSQAPRDFTNHSWRRDAAVRSVEAAIRDGVRGTSMPAWHALDPGEVSALTAYVLSIAQEGP
jgi:mono/diheme cytochrome c family protein